MGIGYRQLGAEAYTIRKGVAFVETHVAWIDDVHVLTVIVNELSLLLNTEEPPIIYWAAKEKYFLTKVEQVNADSTVRFILLEELPIGENLVLLWGTAQIPVYPRAIVRTDWFDRHYSNLNTTLGIDYDDSATTFSIHDPAFHLIRCVSYM